MKFGKTLASIVLAGTMALGAAGCEKPEPIKHTPQIYSPKAAIQPEKKQEFSYKDCKIAFISDNQGEDSKSADNKNKLWIMNADGSSKERLTESYTESAYPDWSPDGKKILFISIRDNRRDIYCVNLDNKKTPKELISTGGKNLCPQWSSDGNQFAFVSNLAGGVSEICVSNLELGRINRFYQRTKGANAEGYMCWSPDGKKIAFIAHEDKNLEIKVMNADGSELRSLTNHFGFETTFCWSPDSKRIAFTSYSREENPVRGEPDIYSINVDSTGLQRLTSDPDIDTDPVYSPDGKKIAFTSYRDKKEYGYSTEIYVMNSDGSNQINLTKNGGDDDDPQWSPDGKKIAFVSGRIAKGESGLISPKKIYIMDADGNNVNLLTPTEGYKDSFLPRWSTMPSTK
ncbi:MAG: hypothetical protein ABH840_00355 [Nanoarchaeota archaeon]